ncbi:Cof-type HAD-IIB family hydrolase [Dubosiella newyorkensis]|uniref:Cof-type HAD-IIB family hydrolase n=1 Tax=Dubosiella newyorkensis TaxID=1862672 RepID=UPI0025B7A266|nr:Cof-type HAD-IIB family hydrolase [Dubosiella newyorkensis]
MSETVTLVASDLDGTLLNSQKKVTPETREALKQLKNHGILFGIASGRPVESGIILVKDWGLEDDISFLIGMNGGVIYDMRTKEKEQYHLMDGETILEIMEHYKDMDVIFQVMVGNDRYVNKSTEETKGRKVNKLILFIDPSYMDQVKARAATFSSDRFTSYATADNLYEYTDPMINKGFGIQKICEHYGIDPVHVVAFGDAPNDKEMLEDVGYGVAMKNATEDVKAVADVVSSYTNDEDALAHFVTDEILKNNPDRLEKDANVKVG